MKIEYFEREYLHWGIILKRFIDENSKDYISHTENLVNEYSRKNREGRYQD
jgi:hypothetical protein